MIAVQGVSKFLGQRDLFRKVSFNINPGEKIGLIGTNGAGKTTLFHILLDEVEPDDGVVAKCGGMRLGHLPQQWTPPQDKTVLGHAMDIHEEILRLREELALVQEALQDELEAVERIHCLAHRQSQILELLEHMEGYDLEARANRVLAGLGFRPETLDRPAATLSGGWAMRLELARLLLSEPDLLLLDEPTNHLDLASLLWLEQYLITTRSALLLISHDRAFLNSVVNRILELEGGELYEYSGNYEDYLREKALRLEIQQASYENQQTQIRQMERFIEKNRVRASTAKRAQSRMKALDRMEIMDAPAGDGPSIHFAFPEPPRSGRRVLELSAARKTYGDNVVYAGVNLVVERGDRIAFVGENGAGKSTLLKMLAGVEELSGGQCVVGHGAVLGYYAQHHWEQLHPDWTALQEVASVAGDMAQSTLRGLLGAFLFRGDDVLKRVTVLSGGEKARLTLCKLLLHRPNVLLLDEPTNHLDIPSRDVLEKAMKDFTGTILFISHDRHFINAIANKVLAVQNGTIELFPGSFSDYETIWKARLDGGNSEPRSVPAEGASRSKIQEQERRRLEAERRNDLYRLKRPLQKQLDGVESTLEKAQTDLDRINAQLADPTTYQGGGNRVQELQKTHEECRRKVQELTQQWEDLALELERLEMEFLNNGHSPS